MDMKQGRDKFIHAALLFIIVSLFVLLTFEHIDTNLSSPHPQKYQRVVGPAVDMAKTGSPFRYVNILKVDPTNDIPGYTNYPHIPFMEVGLAIFILLSPFSIHITTHMFANTLGIILLLLFFFHTYMVFDYRFAILSTAFLSGTYYMNLLSLLTVQDTVMFIFFFSSLVCLEKYWKYRNIRYLTFAGVLAGLGFNAKYSLALILFPMTLILFWQRLDALDEYWTHLSFFYMIFAVPELVFKLFIKPIPSSYVYILLTMFALVLLICILKRDIYLMENYRIIINTIRHNQVMLISSLIIIPSALTVVFFLLGFDQYLGSFITISPSLLFNMNIYQHMLVEQLKPSLTDSIFYLGLFGVFLTPFSSLRQPEKATLYSFIFGTSVYWMLALKPIFFHTYYKFIFGVLFSLLSSTVLYEMTKFIDTIIDRYRLKNGKVLSTSLVVIIVILLTFSAVQPVIGSDFSGHDTNEAADYLRDNTKHDTLFLSQNGGYMLSIPAERKSVNMPKLTDEEIKRDISRDGFGTAMRSMNVKYIVTRGPIDTAAVPGPNASIQGIGEYRASLIRYEVMNTGEPSSVYYETSGNSFGKEVEKSIEFEKEVQDFYFYRIKESTNSSISQN